MHSDLQVVFELYPLQLLPFATASSQPLLTNLLIFIQRLKDMQHNIHVHFTRVLLPQHSHRGKLKKIIYKFIHWHTGQHTLQAPSTRWLLMPVLLNSKLAQEKYSVKKGNPLPTTISRNAMEKGICLENECASAVPSSTLLLLTPICIWFSLTYIFNLFYYYFRGMFWILLCSEIKALLHCTVINTGLMTYLKVSISAWVPVIWARKKHALIPTCN